MCGLVGSTGASLGAVQRALGLIVHRGPDSSGLAVAGSVTLAMRRLAIIDVQGGDQPLSNEDGTVTVVCNGELYNYVELRDELRARGHRFATGSDVEVVVHLYEELGERCFDLRPRSRLAQVAAVRVRDPARAAPRLLARIGAARMWIYTVVLAVQLALLLAAAVGVGIARHYVLVSWATIVALWNYVRRGVPAIWDVAPGTR